MAKSLVTGLAAVAATGLLAACSSGSGSAASGGSGGSGGGQQSSTAMTIATRTVAGVGTVLTDQSGKTLYTPKEEAQGTIKCTASCLGFWFPVKAGSGGGPHVSGSVSGKFGTVQRPDGGGSQLTYNGKPLYTFKLDSAAGQAHGNNFSDKFGDQSFTWQAVTASGGAGGGAPAPSNAGTPSSGYSYGSGGGGGY